MTKVYCLEAADTVPASPPPNVSVPFTVMFPLNPDTVELYLPHTETRQARNEETMTGW